MKTKHTSKAARHRLLTITEDQARYLRVLLECDTDRLNEGDGPGAITERKNHKALLKKLNTEPEVTTYQPIRQPVGEHTPTPWYAQELNRAIGGPGLWIRGTEQSPICFDIADLEPGDFTPALAEQRANAVFTVRAVNSHDKLVENLKACVAIIKQYAEESGPCDHAVGICVCGLRAVIEESEAAIAKATSL